VALEVVSHCPGLQGSSTELLRNNVGLGLGTLQRGNDTFVGLVLRDSVVVNIARASAALERAPGAAKVRTPRDMKELISRYEEIRARLYAIAPAANAAGQRSGYVYDLKSVKILPPVMYPTTILNAAVNYREHDAEMQARPGAEARPKDPPNPSPVSGSASRTTRGRTRICSPSRFQR
jgi:2-keto-4-pentenoate hydratase/2-oxohepta-3-ene-1,7-dioic acid hydratase in catechol pathway